MRRAAWRCAGNGGLLPFSRAQRVLVVSKVTRYENELARLESVHGSRAEALMQDEADSKGSDLEWLHRTHEAHETFVEALVRGIRRLPRISSVQVVKCYGGLRREHIADADFVFSMGGDGTFLRTASFIQDFERAPLLCGINTDPHRSEGFLCVNHDAAAPGEGAGPPAPTACPVGHPEHVDGFLACLSSPGVHYITRQRIRVSVVLPCGSGAGVAGGSGGQGSRLLALNDVLVSESEAQKTSYYELRFVGAGAPESEPAVVEKQKSSGLLISTGTGSTAWSRSVSSLQPAVIRQVLELLGEGRPPDGACPQRIAEELNRGLSFEPDSQLMRFVVREPIVNGIFTCDSSMGFARSVAVRPRSPGMHVFADGQLIAPLPLGHVANFSIHTQDALRAVHWVEACH